MENPIHFFRRKRPWSKYKDLILDYYLQPYLAKVARLRRPILIVDCFAGAGKFDDGEIGSPLIICRHLRSLYQNGVDVKGYFIESNPELYNRLKSNTATIDVPVTTRQGSFRDYVQELAQLVKNHTVFVYLDPLRPGELLFNDLKSVYDQLQLGSSVETLINFMSRSFHRRIRAVPPAEFDLNRFPPSRNVNIFNDIAGGNYWRATVPKILSTASCVDILAQGYCNNLHDWFKWVLSYPVKDKYHHKQPKYHLIFGSRYPDAVDLMNRAMVKARREFIKDSFVKPMLFPNQPADEVIDLNHAKRIIVETSQIIGRSSWKYLRINATIKHPARYTDSEFNSAIKRALQESLLASNFSGKKIEDSANIWPVGA